MKKSNSKRVSPKEFVKIWQTAVTLQEVMTKTGLTRTGASTRANFLRKRGVESLKRFRVGPKVPKDYAELETLAKSYCIDQLSHEK